GNPRHGDAHGPAGVVDGGAGLVECHGVDACADHHHQPLAGAGWWSTIGVEPSPLAVPDRSGAGGLARCLDTGQCRPALVIPVAWLAADAVRRAEPGTA